MCKSCCIIRGSFYCKLEGAVLPYSAIRSTNEERLLLLMQRIGGNRLVAMRANHDFANGTVFALGAAFDCPFAGRIVPGRSADFAFHHELSKRCPVKKASATSSRTYASWRALALLPVPRCQRSWWIAAVFCSAPDSSLTLP